MGVGARLGLVLAVFATACADPPTQVIVLLEAESGALEPAERVQVRACTDFDGDALACGERYREERRLDDAPAPIPGRVPIGPPRDVGSRFWIEASLLAADGSVRASARATGAYLPGQTREVTLTLESACLDVTCGPTETCRAGACVDACVDADCGPGDAGPPPADAGPSCECPCASDTCVDGECLPARRVDQVTVGRFHTLARVGGEVLAWGENTQSQLGLGEAMMGALVDTPTPVPTPTPATQVSAGYQSSCVILEPGELWCWGNNGSHRLALPSPELPRHVPTAVGTERNWARVSLYSRHTCALTSTGRLYCWGRALDGQLGVHASPIVPPEFEPSPVFLGGSYMAVAVGNDHTCAIDITGAVACWGENAQGQSGADTPSVRNVWVPTSLGSRYSNLASGIDRSCAIAADGQIHCWGDNRDERLGVGAGSPVVVDTPTPVVSPDRFRAIALGSEHQCAITNDGRLLCWGLNLDGQLGVGDATTRTEPTEVAGAGPWSAVASSYLHTCAIHENGALYCWGRGEAGQLSRTCGRDDATAPCRVCID